MNFAALKFWILSYCEVSPHYSGISVLMVLAFMFQISFLCSWLTLHWMLSYCRVSQLWIPSSYEVSQFWISCSLWSWSVLNVMLLSKKPVWSSSSCAVWFGISSHVINHVPFRLPPFCEMAVSGVSWFFSSIYCKHEVVCIKYKVCPWVSPQVETWKLYLSLKYNYILILAAFKTTFMIYIREIMHFSKIFNDGPLTPIDGSSGP